MENSSFRSVANKVVHPDTAAPWAVVRPPEILSVRVVPLATDHLGVVGCEAVVADTSDLSIVGYLKATIVHATVHEIHLQL